MPVFRQINGCASPLGLRQFFILCFIEMGGNLSHTAATTTVLHAQGCCANGGQRKKNIFHFSVTFK